MAGKDVLNVAIADGIATITLGSPGRIHLDAEMGAALDEAAERLEADARVRAIILTGGAPGYFVRHYSVAELIAVGERLKESGAKVADTDAPRFFGLDHAIRRFETMAKPSIAAISGSCMGGGFELALGCDIRIAQEGDFRIGLPEVNLGILPGAGGTQRLPRLVGTGRALFHILMGVPLTPAEAARQGFVHETVAGSALERAREIAARLSVHDADAVARIKRLVREATERPLTDGLALERNLFLQLAGSNAALERMRAYEAGTLEFAN